MHGRERERDAMLHGCRGDKGRGCCLVLHSDTLSVSNSDFAWLGSIKTH